MDYNYYTMEVDDVVQNNELLETNESEDEECFSDNDAIDLSIDKPLVMAQPPSTAQLYYDKTDFDDEWNLQDDMLQTYKWLSMYESTTLHMYVCHDEFEYVRNERYPAEIYKQLYHQKYGNAYEFYVKQIKIFITTRFLVRNNITEDKHPKEEVDKTKNMTKLAFFLHYKTSNGLTLKQQLVYALHSSNLIGLNYREISLYNDDLNKHVNSLYINDLKNKYSWKSEDGKIKKILKNAVDSNINTLLSPVQQMFRVSFEFPSLLFRKDETLCHDNYIRAFEAALAGKGESVNYVDCVKNVKWLYKDIINVLADKPKLGNLKAFESDETEVREFVKLSALNPVGHLVFHTKTKHRNREHFRLNCFRMDSVHVWVNTMVFDKNDASKKLDLEKIIRSNNWGTHYVIRAHYVYNLRLAKMHVEAVKLVMRYILSRRDFNLLHKDLQRQSKLSLDFIDCAK